MAESVVNVVVKIDERKLRDAISRGEGLAPVLWDITTQITGNANMLCQGFRTGIWHDEDGNELGDTPARYAGDVIQGKRGPVGIVHPANYSAMKDNYENNTLLKAKG